MLYVVTLKDGSVVVDAPRAVTFVLTGSYASLKK